MKKYEAMVDTTAEMDPEFDLETWQAKQIARLHGIACMANHASGIPRRLGEDASPVELGIDKRFSRKLRNLCLSLIKDQWRTPEAVKDIQKQMVGHVFTAIPDDAEWQPDYMRPEGAQVNWYEFLDEHVITVREQAAYMANQLHLRKEFKEANRMYHRLEQELAQFDNLRQRVLTAANEDHSN